MEYEKGCVKCCSTTNLRKMCGTDQMERLGIQFYKCAECDAESDEDDDYEETDDEEEEDEEDEEECCEWCSSDATDGYKLKTELELAHVAEMYLPGEKTEVLVCRVCGQGYLTDYPNHGHKKNQEEQEQE